MDFLGPVQPIDPEAILRLFRFHIAGIEVTQRSSTTTESASHGPRRPGRRQLGRTRREQASLGAGLRPQRLLTRPHPRCHRHARGRAAVLRVSLSGRVASPAARPPGTVTAESNPAYATERGTITSSLNFILPADRMCGHLKLIASVTAPGGASDTFELLVDATLKQTLRLRGILVGYNGPSSTAAGAPNLTLAAPSLADLQSTSGWALRAFPVQSTATSRAGERSRSRFRSPTRHRVPAVAHPTGSP